MSWHPKSSATSMVYVIKYYFNVFIVLTLANTRVIPNSSSRSVETRVLIRYPLR